MAWSRQDAFQAATADRRSPSGCAGRSRSIASQTWLGRPQPARRRPAPRRGVSIGVPFTSSSRSPSSRPHRGEWSRGSRAAGSRSGLPSRQLRHHARPRRGRPASHESIQRRAWDPVAVGARPCRRAARAAVCAPHLAAAPGSRADRRRHPASRALRRWRRSWRRPAWRRPCSGPAVARGVVADDGDRPAPIRGWRREHHRPAARARALLSPSQARRDAEQQPTCRAEDVPLATMPSIAGFGRRSTPPPLGTGRAGAAWGACGRGNTDAIERRGGLPGYDRAQRDSGQIDHPQVPAQHFHRDVLRSAQHSNSCGPGRQRRGDARSRAASACQFGKIRAPPVRTRRAALARLRGSRDNREHESARRHCARCHVARRHLPVRRRPPVHRRSRRARRPRTSPPCVSTSFSSSQPQQLPAPHLQADSST